MQICFSIKRKIEIGKYTASLTFLWYDNFGKNCTPLQKNGLASIPKMQDIYFFKISSPKEDIFLTTFYGLDFSDHYTYRVPFQGVSLLHGLP